MLSVVYLTANLKGGREGREGVKASESGRTGGWSEGGREREGGGEREERGWSGGEKSEGEKREGKRGRGRGCRGVPFAAGHSLTPSQDECAPCLLRGTWTLESPSSSVLPAPY